VILALKLVLTPTLIGIATLVGRRFGPSISGWLVGLPLTSGPVSLFLAIEQGTAFAASAAAGSLTGVGAAAIFALAYAACARRLPWPATVLVASAVFLAAAFALDQLMLAREPAAPIVVLYLVGVVAALAVTRAIPSPRGPVPETASPPWDLPARMIVTTGLVLAITGFAPQLGPRLSGLIATYPIYASVLAVFAHVQHGPAAATQVVRGLSFGIVAFATFFLSIGSLVDRTGVAPAFAIAIAGALVVQGVTLTRIRTKASPSPTA
jgi:hypothetical protein